MSEQRPTYNLTPLCRAFVLNMGSPPSVSPCEDLEDAILIATNLTKADGKKRHACLVMATVEPSPSVVVTHHKD